MTLELWSCWGDDYPEIEVVCGHVTAREFNKAAEPHVKRDDFADDELAHEYARIVGEGDDAKIEFREKAAPGWEPVTVWREP